MDAREFTRRGNVFKTELQYKESVGNSLSINWYLVLITIIATRVY